MNGSTISTVSRQWATRPDDERFESLIALRDSRRDLRERSFQKVIANKDLRAVPAEDHKGITVLGPNGAPAIPSHWAFGQLAALSGAPAGYLRTLPSELAADCVNFGLHVARDVEDVKVLGTRDGDILGLRAINGPTFGRVWDSDIAELLVDRFGDGRTGDYRAPGEFGREVNITKANTTFYGSDRDMFVFLCDERNRVEVPNRRNGQPGLMARGFYVSQSEVGAGCLTVAFFMFDYVCRNRTIWGVEQFKSISLRHTSGLPARWDSEIRPVIRELADASPRPMLETIAAAQSKKVADNLDAFLATRFGKRDSAAIKAIHLREEDRPIETLWDVSVAATAFARSMAHQDARVDLERKAGAVLELVAA